MRKEASLVKVEKENGLLSKQSMLDVEVLMEKYIMICDTNSNSVRINFLKLDDTVQYEQALEASFIRIHSKVEDIKRNVVEALGITPEEFDMSL